MSMFTKLFTNLNSCNNSFKVVNSISRSFHSSSILLTSSNNNNNNEDTIKYLVEHTSPGVARNGDSLFVKGRGSTLWDSNGSSFLDFTSGIGVVSTGHCHPKVVKAAQEQCASVVHLQQNIGFHNAMADLLPKLQKVTPDPLNSFCFFNSGSEAVEGAVRLARHATKKPYVIAFHGQFHGRTLGAQSLTSSSTIYRAGFGPHMSGVAISHFPYCLHCPAKSLHANGCCGEGERQLEETLAHVAAPSEVAAILLEPVLGEGGYVTPPVSFVKKIREICDKNDILFICDEVQAGFGRTGKFFAIEHTGVVPDILIMAKGIASGYPLSAIASTHELQAKQPKGSVGGTYGGNAVACAAASATIDIFEEENILDNVNARGAQIHKRFNEAKQNNAKFAKAVREIRGDGLMIGIEFSDDTSIVPKGFTAKLVGECKKRGLLLLTCSTFETIRLIPPLVVTEEEVDKAVDIIIDSFNSVI